MRHFDRQPPKKTQRPSLYVSEHALLRFRERMEEEFLHRDDVDLSALLNERIHAAVLSREVIDPREPGIPTKLHLFESRSGKRSVAVVRDKTVVTVLDDWMAQNNYPGWEEGSIRPSAPLVFSLAAKILALAILPSTCSTDGAGAP